MGTNIQRTIEIITRFRQIGDKSALKGIKKANNSLRSFGRFTGRVARTAGRVGRGLRFMWKQLFRFRAEMLSVLFFGMALQRFFSGLLKPALEAAGIFEIFSTILQLLFLPIALALIDPLLALLDIILNLSDDAKLAIGKFVLFGAALGAILFIVGTLVLGIAGLITAVATFIVTGLAIFGILKIFDLFFPATERVKTAFSGLATSLGELWARFLDLEPVRKFLQTIGLSDEQIEQLKKPWDFLKTTIKNIWTKLMDSINPVIKGFIDDTVDAFKQFIADLLGVSDFEDVKTKWRLFKVFTLQIMRDISKFWKDNIETLKIPEGIKIILDNIRGIIGGALIGGAFAGPIGAVAGGVAGAFGEETGRRLGEGMERLADIFERLDVNPFGLELGGGGGDMVDDENIVKS